MKLATAAQRRKNVATARGRGWLLAGGKSRLAAKDSVAVPRLIECLNRYPRPAAVAAFFRRCAAAWLVVFSLTPTSFLGQQEKPKTETAAQAQPQDAPAKTEEDGKLLSVPGGKSLGMSILGNQEAPTSLVIVPWKSSELGGALGISPMLDDSRQPIDKEVFMRMLSYYEIRSEAARPAGAPAKGNETKPATAADRRK